MSDCGNCNDTSSVIALESAVTTLENIITDKDKVIAALWEVADKWDEWLEDVPLEDQPLYDMWQHSGTLEQFTEKLLGGKDGSD